MSTWPLVKNGLPLFVTNMFASWTDIDKFASFNFSLHFYKIFYPSLCRFIILLLYIRWQFKLSCMPDRKSFHTLFILFFDYLCKYKMSWTDIFYCHWLTPKANWRGNFKISKFMNFFFINRRPLSTSSNLRNDFWKILRMTSLVSLQGKILLFATDGHLFVTDRKVS